MSTINFNDYAIKLSRGSHPSQQEQAPADKDAIRNAALEEAASVSKEYGESLVWTVKIPEELAVIVNTSVAIADIIMSLQSQSVFNEQTANALDNMFGGERASIDKLSITNDVQQECKGKNCGTTTGNHSAECISEHERTISQPQQVRP